MRGRVLHILVVLPTALFGCARMSATTELKPDGTVTRRLEFHTQAPDGPQGASMGPKAEDVFALPTGPAWTVTRTKKDQDLTIKAVRTLKAADMMPSDVLLKGAKGAALSGHALFIRNFGCRVSQAFSLKR